MKTVKHTPGPWEVQEEGSNALGFKIYVIIGPQSAIARVYTAFESEEPGLAHANARLIAAAPDLLEAAQWLLAELSSRFDYLDATAEEETTMQHMRDVIAKAEGNQ